MKQRHFMVALDVLDEAQETPTETAFMPVIEPTTEEAKDNTEAEIAAFVNRPNSTGRLDTSSSTRIRSDVAIGTGRIPFSEAAGFSDNGS